MVNVIPAEHQHITIVIQSMLPCYWYYLIAQCTVVPKCSLTELLTWLQTQIQIILVFTLLCQKCEHVSVKTPVAL